MKLEDMEKILKQETSCFSDFDIDSFVVVDTDVYYLVALCGRL